MKIAVGMSGGVDSAVAAYLIKQDGHEVTGVTIRTQKAVGDCGGDNEINDARRVCEQLGIKHVVLDGTKEFEECVINNFVEEYLSGRTPNPCVICNSVMKMKILLDFVNENGLDGYATGHYANVVKLDNGRYAVKRANNLEKDQSYALFRLKQDQLSKLMLPLGSYKKSEIREIAERAGLAVANKKESMDICFVPDGDYVSFIKNRASDRTDGWKRGNFVDVNGNVIGRHRGIICYTIGQRRNLGIDTAGERMYVKEIRKKKNEIVLARQDEISSLGLLARRLNFQAIETLDSERDLFVKIRYNHAGCMATASLWEGMLKCVFHEPQCAITPGQSVVLYDNDVIVGGGYIVGGLRE